jgi:L-fuconate dehydratase
MPITITNMTVRDIRFPTSRTSAGSDAKTPDPDYSAAYLVLHTDDASGLEGHGLTFTLGRGNDLCVEGIKALRHLIIGRTLESITEDVGAFTRQICGDSQLQWVGPEKGVIHMAAGAVTNAVWDLWAKNEGKPLWKLVADMSPEELVRCVNFQHITDAITPDEALGILQKLEPTKSDRVADLHDRGYSAYTTSVGWMGYDDDKLRRLCREALDQGYTHMKVKVGGDPEGDLRRCRLIREEIGPDLKMMLDANQVWDVDEAIENMERLAEVDPWWIEEPTNPDDILGHAKIARAVAPIGVATGEACQNRVMFKQFMQADAIEFCQVDSCRMAGVSDVLAVLLMAAKFNIKVCPHAGGVGLCEYVQHLAMIDYICISGTMEDRVVEYVDHLHEHFFEPVVMKNGRYMPPQGPVRRNRLEAGREVV